MKIVFNGTPVDKKELAPVWARACSPERLRADGGALFQAEFDAAGRLHLGMLPGFIDGHRQYHHSLKMPAAGGVQLIGAITPNATMEIFAKPARRQPAAELSLPEVRATIRSFAAILLEAGFPPEMPLDPAAAELMEIAGIFSAPPPATVGALAVLTEAC